MSNIVLAGTERQDKRPLPLIVAEKWGFKLAYVEEDGVFWYAIRDWLVGVLAVSPRSATQIWANTQQRAEQELSFSKLQFPYTAPNGRTYMMDFTTDRGLYLLTHNLRVTKERPLLKEIIEYLAKAGAFVDLVRRRPETVIESGAIDPDKVLDAVIEEYRRRGKDDAWINARLTGKVKRAMFTAALKNVIIDLSEKHFGLATNEVYLGLWDRTADQLKQEMQLSKSANIRDNQPTLALSYQGIAEEVSAKRLGQREELSWDEAREIVRDVSDLIGIQAQATGRYLGLDLATGKPLLEG